MLWREQRVSDLKKHFLPEMLRNEGYRRRFLKYARIPESTTAISTTTAAAHVVREDRGVVGAVLTLVLYSLR